MREDKKAQEGEACKSCGTGYDDIIQLPHWEPKYHKRMSNSERAAQFAPFAALTGFSDALEKAEREHLKNFK